MIKKLTFTKEQFVRLGDTEPFIITENDGLILFAESFYDLTGAVITLKNGSVKTTRKFTNNFSVPKEVLFSGRLNISVDLYAGGKKVKHWDCLPLRIEEAECQVRAFDEFSAIEARLAALEKENGKLTERLKNYGEIIKKVNEIAVKQNELAETVSALKEN